jgi:hypothetical protein
MGVLNDILLTSYKLHVVSDIGKSEVFVRETSCYCNVCLEGGICDGWRKEGLGKVAGVNPGNDPGVTEDPSVIEDRGRSCPFKKVMGVLNDILLTSYSFVGHSFCCTTEAIAWPFPVANFKIIPTSPNTIQLPVVCYCKETLAIAILAGWSICPIVNK